jgi:hypothetical protein
MHIHSWLGVSVYVNRLGELKILFFFAHPFCIIEISLVQAAFFRSIFLSFAFLVESTAVAVVVAESEGRLVEVSSKMKFCSWTVLHC